jgi:hypothetical protein
MTISSTNRKAGPFLGDGVNTSFPFAFKIFTPADVLVVHADADGLEVALSLGSDYTVSQNSDQNAAPGGTVVLPTALATGTTVTIGSKVPVLQPIDITNLGGFYPRVINDALDRATVQIQQLSEQVDRSLKTAFSVADGVTLAMPVPVPNRVLGWNTDGTALVNQDPASIVTDNSAAVNARLTSTISDYASPLSNKGAALIGWQRTAAGSVARTLWAKAAELKSVLDFGADLSGEASSSAAFQAAFASGGDIYVPGGDYLISSNVVLGNRTNVVFSKGAKLIAGANDLVIISSATAYYSSLVNATFDGNGHSDVRGTDLSNMRLSAGLFGCSFENMSIGVVARYGCFGTQFANMNAWKVPYPLMVLENASVLDVMHPTFDNETAIGGDGTGTGISVLDGSGSNLGVRITGGYIQGFAVGVLDSGIGTNISDTYFEANTSADISASGARSSTYKGLQHFGPSGLAAYKLRSTDSVTVLFPTMASGSRTALYDVDSSNTNMQELRPASAAYLNTPTGSLAYVGTIPISSKGSWTPSVRGTSSPGSATYSTASGSWSDVGGVATFACSITWSGHTGAGNLTVSGLPDALAPSSFSPSRSFCTVLQGVSFTGPVIAAQFSGSGTTIAVQQIDTSGSASLLPLPAAGTLHLSGSYSK